MEMLNNEEKRNMEQSEVTNKLLLEMIKNQKQNTKHLVSVFRTTIICYTILLIAMVVGYFIYESQFEETTWETQEIVQTQEAITDDGGNATVNGGDINYYGNSTSNTEDNNN